MNTSKNSDVGLHYCFTQSEDDASYMIISPISENITNQIHVEVLSAQEQQHISRYLNDNIFGEYQCG